MSFIHDFISQHIHEKWSAFIGGVASLIFPGDVLEKIITGTITGVLIYVITKIIIPWFIHKIRKKCSCDSCKE